MADKIKMPDGSYDLSLVEECTFDKLVKIAEIAAENRAKLDIMEKAITRLEEKLDALQKSQTTRALGVVLKPGQTTPEPLKQATSSPPIRYEAASPWKQQQGMLLESARTPLRPPRTPLGGPPLLSTTTPPRKRRISQSEHDLRGALGPSRVLEFIEIPGAEGARTKATESNTKEQDDKQGASSPADRLDNYASLSNQGLRALANRVRLLQSPLTKSVLSEGPEQGEPKGLKRPFPGDADGKRRRIRKEAGNGCH